MQTFRANKWFHKGVPVNFPARCGLLTILTVAMMAAATHAPTAQAPSSWSQWRGPNRDGSVPQEHVPARWPSAWSARWSVEVGEGYSAPVAADGRIFIHSRRDPEEIVLAISVSTGARVWEQRYPATIAKNQYANEMAKGPNAAPLVADGRVFTLGASAILTAWDAASGKHLWQKDFSRLIDTSKLFCGTAASPVMAHGRLIVQVGSDVHGGRIIALDPATGAAAWEWRGAGPGYASPLVATIDGTSQIITMTNSSVVGVDARSGVELWSSPFTDEWHENITTPTWTGTHLIVSGTRQGTHALALGRKGNAWTVNTAWKNTEVGMYMSSPVFADGLVIGLSARRKGQFVAVDAATGKVAWASEGRDADHASVLLTPTHIVFLTATGDLLTVPRSPSTFTKAHTWEVATRATYAVPAFIGGDLLVRDATHLSRLGPQ
jgi:outer membrane protein assembly factor BamB